MLCVGNLVQISEYSWQEYLKAEGLRDCSPPGVRTVVRVSEEGILLDFPLHFWDESDLLAAPSHRVMIQR
jgi:hypothetical protein